MNAIMTGIADAIDAAVGEQDFLDALFGEDKADALAGRPVVIFGAGSLGQEMCATLRRRGVSPVAFGDSDRAKAGQRIANLPVLTVDELARSHRNSLIVAAAARHRELIGRRLADAGFASIGPACTGALADFVYMYAMVGTQVLIAGYETQCRPESYLAYLRRREDRLAQAHDLLEDDRSRALMVAKLALLASRGNFRLFCDFMANFSEPYRDFGLTGYDGTPEDHYYFNNDVLRLDDGEIYVDIGAYDGDTVATFVEACRQRGVAYARIVAFEPDADCHARLLVAASAYRDVACHCIGLWSESTRLRFESSARAIHDQAAIISDAGDTEIEAVSLDDFIGDERVTFIKADPGGNIIPQVLRGAAATIRRHRPKLAVGAYHGADSIFELPILVSELCRDYRIHLRHNTLHLCDTDLLATCQ